MACFHALSFCKIHQEYIAPALVVTTLSLKTRHKKIHFLQYTITIRLAFSNTCSQQCKGHQGSSNTLAQCNLQSRNAVPRKEVDRENISSKILRNVFCKDPPLLIIKSFLAYMEIFTIVYSTRICFSLFKAKLSGMRSSSSFFPLCQTRDVFV